MKIPLSKLKKGDKVCHQGDSGFCDASIERITKVGKRYNPKTGKPYKVFWINDMMFDEDGYALNPPLAYYIVPCDQKEKEELTYKH